MFLSGPIITQSEATAAQRTFTFNAVDATDGYTAETGLTFATSNAQVSKNGAAFGNMTGTVTELANGVYVVAASAADCDTVGEALFKFVNAACRNVFVRCQISLFDNNVALTSQGVADAAGLVSKNLKPRAIAMGSLAANGSTAGFDVTAAYQTIITVTGTWGGGSLQVQTCADPTATVPVWSSSGSPLTANGSVTVAGPVKVVRATLSGATSPALAVSAIAQDFR